jgi:hypothetical protein
MVGGALLYDVTRDGMPRIGEWKPIIAVETNQPNIGKPQKTKAKRYRCKLFVTKTCFCGKTFKAKRNDAAFCSSRCRQVASRQNRQLRLSI